MNVLNREVFDKQTASIFPSWTSRVRSPSPAFSFIDLRAYRFRKYSKYSVKKQDVRYLRAFAPESALQTKPLAGAEGRVFVTASLGFCRHPQQVAPRCALGANCRGGVASIPSSTPVAFTVSQSGFESLRMRTTRRSE